MIQKSKFLYHDSCEICGSSDAVAVYSDGGRYCWSHGEYLKKKEEDISTDNYNIVDQFLDATKSLETTERSNDQSFGLQDQLAIKTLKIRPLPTEFHALADRNISEATARKYGVTYVLDENQSLRHVYPYFDKNGQHVANKLRYKGKSFSTEGEIGRTVLFGQQLFPPGSAKQISLTEGEADCMAAYEMQGSKYPVVSVKNAATAQKDCAQEFLYLDSFEIIVICFDKDEAKINPSTGAVHYPGQEAALAVAGLFKPGKVRILTLQEYKDANDYLLYGKSKEFMQEWWSAPVHTPAGLRLGSSLWEEIIKPRNYESVSYPWTGLDKATYGLRLSELVLVTADRKVGKTSAIKEIGNHILNVSTYGLGLMLLEETNFDTCLGFMSIAANKRLHLPDVRASVSIEELKEYYDKTVNNDRTVIYDHFGSNSIIEILTKIRHMVALGCRYIILDHLSIIVSDQSGDERKQLDEISTKLKMLAMELNICIIAVIHLNRQGSIRGSAVPEQLANIVIKLHRNMLDESPWRRNITKVVVEANRFSGDTGPVEWLEYDKNTGRMIPLTEDQISEFEAGMVVPQSVDWKGMAVQ